MKKSTSNLPHLLRFHPWEVNFSPLPVMQMNRQCQPPRLESPTTRNLTTSLCPTNEFGTQSMSCFAQTNPRIKTLPRVYQRKATMVANTCLDLVLLRLSAIFTKFDLVNDLERVRDWIVSISVWEWIPLDFGTV